MQQLAVLRTRHWFKQAIALIGITTLVALMISVSSVRADISLGDVSVVADNDIAGLENARYDVTFTTDETNPASVIYVTFPNDYTITDGLLGTASASICNNGCAISGVISRGAGNLAVSSVVGDSDTNTIIISLNDAANLSTAPISFRLKLGITNPTAIGIYGNDGEGNEFIIDTDAVDEEAEITTSEVTIVADAAVELRFDTQPDGSVSGVALTDQPEVCAYDQFGNVVESYTETITLTASDGADPALENETEDAVAGCADFATGTDLIFFASEDNQEVILTASDGDLEIESDSFISDVMATQFTVFVMDDQEAPNGDIVSGVEFSIQVAAVDAEFVVDNDYEEEVTVDVTPGADGDFEFEGEALNATSSAMTESGFVNFSLTFFASADQETLVIDAASAGDAEVGESDILTADVVATQIVLDTEPADVGAVNGDIINGVVFATQPVVEFQDGDGLVDTDIDDVDVTMSVDEGDGDLSDDTATATNGVATFAGIAYTTDVDGDLVIFSFASGEFEPVASAELTVDAIATKLVITSVTATGADEPIFVDAEVVSGQAFDVTVEAVDEADVLDVDYDSTGQADIACTAGGAGDCTLAEDSFDIIDGEAAIADLVYVASEDHEEFSLEAIDTVDGELDSSDLLPVIADVIATDITIEALTAAGYDGDDDVQSGLAFTVEVSGVDAEAVNDVDFGATDDFDLTENGAGTLNFEYDEYDEDTDAAVFDVTYLATVDHEEFDLTASYGEADDTMVELIADVVASKFLLTFAVNNPLRNTATAMTITAADAQNKTDIDYDPTDKEYAFTDAQDAALSTHTSGSSTPIIPTNATIRAAFEDGVTSGLAITFVKVEVLGAVTVSDGDIEGTSESITVRSTGSSGGGGGGSTSTPIPTPIPTPTPPSGTDNLGGCAFNNATEKLLCEGSISHVNSPESIAEIVGRNRGAAAEQAARLILERIAANAPEAIKDRILWFITYGTPSTVALGAGERGGVVNSFQAAFGRLPTSEADWQDVIKLANGRWPGQRNVAAEDRAKASFTSIYRRAANMNNARDNAAVTIMAYGMRPVPRNVASEAAAISTYRAVFNHQPATATAWDAVRAIAYSGATR